MKDDKTILPILKTLSHYNDVGMVFQFHLKMELAIDEGGKKVKRGKYKSNKVLVFFLCVFVACCSIKLAVEGGNGIVTPYRIKAFTLTQGQSHYDLTVGISYDTAAYILMVADKGLFNINKPGMYQVRYLLSPIARGDLDQDMAAIKPELSRPADNDVETDPADTVSNPQVLASECHKPVSNPPCSQKSPSLTSNHSEHTRDSSVFPSNPSTFTSNPSEHIRNSPALTPNHPELSTKAPLCAPNSSEATLESISFTREVVVKPAVTYQDLRLDVNEKADLLTDMSYDTAEYSVSVLDDDHFSSDRIDEYKVSYELTNAENKNKIAELARYVWVTAPGAAFEAPPLTVDASEKLKDGEDLLKDIQYDNRRYHLSLVDPNEFNATELAPQRVMYRLTLREDSAKAKDERDGKTTAAIEKSSSYDSTAISEADEQDSQCAAVFGREVTVKNSAYLESTEPTDRIEPVEGIEPTKRIESVEGTEPTERTESIESRKSTRNQ